MSTRPLTKTFGAQVLGVKLAEEPLTEALVERLKLLLRQHRLLLFRDQAPISGEQQVKLSQAFGELESTFSKHPRSPHPEIFRVSNWEGEGCTQVGRSGWHIDGTFLMKPFKIQTMHFPSTIKGGDTLFMPLKEFFESRSQELQTRWKNTWMITKYGVVHPLVHQHPLRQDMTMVFHCGRPFVAGWLQNQTVVPATVIQDEISANLEEAFPEIGFRAEWKQNDFAIIDNLAVAHFAVESTQTPHEQAGIRILHRTTISGEHIPRKSTGETSFQQIQT